MVLTDQAAVVLNLMSLCVVALLATVTVLSIVRGLAIPIIASLIFNCF